MRALAPAGRAPYTDNVMSKQAVVHKEQFVVDEKGRRKAVILPVEEYEELMEDLHDLAVAAERREEGTAATEDMRRRLKARGVL